MLGLAIGPAIAATVVTANDYGRVLTMGIVLFFVAWGLILPPLIVQRRQALR